MNAVARPAFSAVSICCPCCGGRVETPTLDMVIDRYSISAKQADVLRVVWNGRGHPVRTERIFEAMYANDPNGGPTHRIMYERLKAILFRLREKLEGSGISIELAGHNCGYRLKLKGK